MSATLTPNSKRKLHSLYINRAGELAQLLRFPLEKLKSVANHLPDHYTAFYKIIGNKRRRLFNCDKLLRDIHYKIERHLLDRLEIPPEIHGGVVGRSSATNAAPHVGKKQLAQYDISNFFPSTSSGRIYQLFCNLGCCPDAASLLTKLTTTEGALPQGFGTSPKLAALVSLRLSKRMQGLAQKSGQNVSLYVDDLAFSGERSMRPYASTISKIVREEGYLLNSKTKYSSRRRRQKVTGVVVNKKAGIPNERLRTLRSATTFIKRYGLKNYRDRYYPGESLQKVRGVLAGEIGYAVSANPKRYAFMKESLLPLLKS